jgi:EAL domain-containing protein (putative c-di-GMP-specific phosphodiesterase class I)
MKVTAEGVETAEQQLFLRAAGVHSMQGYRFGRPCPPGRFA